MSHQMHKDEKVLLKTNPSRWNYWQGYAIALGGATIFPPALLAIPLLEYYRKTTNYTITSDRIIKKNNFIGKKVDSIPHDAVINVHVGQTPVHRLMNIGNVRVGTQSNDLKHLTLKGVYNPEKVGNVIQKALREFHERQDAKNHPIPKITENTTE